MYVHVQNEGVFVIQLSTANRLSSKRYLYKTYISTNILREYRNLTKCQHRKRVLRGNIYVISCKKYLQVATITDLLLEPNVENMINLLNRCSKCDSFRVYLHKYSDQDKNTTH